MNHEARFIPLVYFPCPFLFSIGKMYVLSRVVQRKPTKVQEGENRGNTINDTTTIKTKQDKNEPNVDAAVLFVKISRSMYSGATPRTRAQPGGNNSLSPPPPHHHHHQKLHRKKTHEKHQKTIALSYRRGRSDRQVPGRAHRTPASTVNQNRTSGQEAFRHPSQVGRERKN